MRLFRQIFTPSVGTTTFGVLTVVAILFAFLGTPQLDLSWKIAVTIIVVLVYLCVVLLLCVRDLSRNSCPAPIKVLRQVGATGLSANAPIVVLENPGYLREHTLLTLCSDASGTEQPIAILEVTKATRGEDLHASAFPIGTSLEDLGRYFDGQNRTTLYAVPLIHSAEFLRYCGTVQEAATAAQTPSIINREQPAIPPPAESRRTEGTE